MWGLPLEPEAERAESADMVPAASAVSAMANAESPEKQGKPSGMPLAPPGTMTVKELEQRMEERFDAIEKRDTAPLQRGCRAG
jgi:hypothetical protein